MKHICLLTGPPRAGKTTLIKEAVRGFSGSAGGFYTEEIRERGDRTGFRLVTLDGRDAILSHISIHSPYRVGKYGVDITALEQTGVAALLEAEKHSNLVVVDEIGKMEMLSLKFREAVLQIIANNKKTLGTILLHHHAWSDAIKARPEVNLLMLNRDNYASVLGQVREWLEKSQ